MFSALALACAGLGAQAQQLSQSIGDAARVDVLQEARTLSMRDPHARALYLFIRTNPGVMQDAEFYVNFLVYLMAQSEDFNCRAAFANEFERQSFFESAFGLAPQLTQIVGGVTITQRFDVSFIVPTEKYDFNTAILPLGTPQAVGGEGLLSGSTYAGGASRNDPRSCARTILQGTTIDPEAFPWSFQVVKEDGSRGGAQFPFERKLQLPASDAQQLFERFGRRLYAIVSYRIQAANDGTRKIQVIPTDGNLFGLSTDAVVRVRSFAHPSLSQPAPMDITNPLAMTLPDRQASMDLSFQQQGFRSVGAGTRTGGRTEFSAARETPIAGSAAVGSSAFIMRLSWPEFTGTSQRAQFVTLFGNIDYEAVTQTEAPVSGSYSMLQWNERSSRYETTGFSPFSGQFRAGDAPEAEEAPAQAAPESQLDTLTIEDIDGAEL
ncbi:MAG: hypothetical protein AAGF60_08110 [Pseudomonadota bacterium]